MDNQEIDITNFTSNLKEIYQDFQTLEPYAKYKPKLVPKIAKTALTVTEEVNEEENQTEKTVTNKNEKVTCDLVIVLDCTGSMSSWIERCKQYIITIIDDVKSQFKQSELRVGFVAYRDIEDNPNVQVFDFISKDYDKVKSFISKLTANGGGDLPEDLAGGLKAALQLQWKSSVKCLFIITDAPCHGKKYHDSGDSYPEGDPNGIKIEDVISQMGKKGIDITAIDIYSITDNMYSIFNEVYQEARGKPINRLKIGDTISSNNTDPKTKKAAVEKNDFGSSISKTVISSITGTSFNSKNTFKRIEENSGDSGEREEDKLCLKALRILQQNKGLLNTQCLSVTELENTDVNSGNTKKFQTKYATKAGEILEEENSDCEENEEDEIEEKKSEYSGLSKREEHQIISSKYYPTKMDDLKNWYENMKSNDVFTLICTCFTPYVDKSQPVDWRKPNIKFNKLSSKIKVYKKYFSDGAMRQAFYAYDTVLNQKLVAKLHKNMKDNSNFELMKRDCMSLIASHYFAEEFNSRILITSKNSEDMPNLLNFVDSTIYEVQKHFNQDIKYYFVENYIEGEYQKYNNNAGWTLESNSSEFSQISQAFSHFTWQYSQGQLLVVDIQGGELGILTDPQIHTKNRSRLYGQGDLGYEGMLKFFYTHHCNAFCTQLGLIHPIVKKEVPENFTFFSDLFGLQNIEEKQSEQNEVIVEVKEEKKEEKEEVLIELPNKKQEMAEQQQNQKKQKKKRGQALREQYEKERLQQEEEEKRKEEEEKKRIELEKLEAKKKKQAEELEKKKQEQLKAKLNPQVGTQCQFCKKCFQADLKKVIQNKIAKKETLCNDCEYQCNISLIDISCSVCHTLFQSSKYYNKMKKQNIVGQCLSCRE